MEQVQSNGQTWRTDVITATEWDMNYVSALPYCATDVESKAIFSEIARQKMMQQGLEMVIEDEFWIGQTDRRYQMKR